jgi:hypothetical protein
MRSKLKAAYHQTLCLCISTVKQSLVKRHCVLLDTVTSHVRFLFGRSIIQARCVNGIADAVLTIIDSMYVWSTVRLLLVAVFHFTRKLEHYHNQHRNCFPPHSQYEYCV